MSAERIDIFALVQVFLDAHREQRLLTAQDVEEVRVGLAALVGQIGRDRRAVSVESSLFRPAISHSGTVGAVASHGARSARRYQRNATPVERQVLDLAEMIEGALAPQEPAPEQEPAPAR